MRKYLVACMVAAMAFSVSGAYATVSLDDPAYLKASVVVKKLDYDGVTELNPIIISQNTDWSAAEVVEVNFDLCAIDVGPAGTTDTAENYYKLPYVVDWSKATVNPASTTLTPVNVFYDAGLAWQGGRTNILRAEPPNPAADIGDGARALLTAGTAGKVMILNGVQIIQNIFPWTPRNYVVRASFTPTSGVTAVYNPMCNDRFYHAKHYLLATYGAPCETFLKFGFVIGGYGYMTILVVSSDMSTTCRDDVADQVDYYAWDDMGNFLGKSTDNAYPLDPNGQSLMIIGFPGFTFGDKEWEDANPGGIGQVIARAGQSFAHGVAIITSDYLGIVATYLALHDPSITRISDEGHILREDWYNFVEPYQGYIH